MLNPRFGSQCHAANKKTRGRKKGGLVAGGVTNRLRQVIDKHRTQYRCQSENPAKIAIHEKGGPTK